MGCLALHLSSRFTMMGPPDNIGVNKRAVRELLRVCDSREDVDYTIQVQLGGQKLLGKMYRAHSVTFCLAPCNLGDRPVRLCCSEGLFD